MAQWKGEEAAEVEPPEVEAALEWWIQAFYRLTHSRQFGMTIGPIPMTEIRCYMEMLPPPDIFTLGDTLDILQTMDHAFVSGTLADEKDRQARATEQAKRRAKR